MAITTAAIMVAATTEAITRRHVPFPALIAAFQFQEAGCAPTATVRSASFEGNWAYSESGPQAVNEGCGGDGKPHTGQVGKAAIIAWQDVLAPALRDGGLVPLWPFDWRSAVAPGAGGRAQAGGSA